MTNVEPTKIIIHLFELFFKIKKEMSCWKTGDS